MKPGTHKAKVLDFGISNSRSGNLQAFIKFDCEGLDPKESSSVYWYGSLDKTEKTSKAGKPYTRFGMTMGQLNRMGFKSSEASALTEANTLPMDKTFTIEVEEFTTPDGTKIPTVRKIITENDGPKGGGEKKEIKKLSKKEAAMLLGEPLNPIKTEKTEDVGF